MRHQFVFITLFLLQLFCQGARATDCSPETILSSSQGSWYGEIPGHYKAWFDGIFNGSDKPWELFTAKVKIEEGIVEHFELRVVRNKSFSSQATHYLLQVLHDGKEEGKYALTNCLENEGKLIFTQEADRTVNDMKIIDSRMIILSLSQKTLLFALESGDPYCSLQDGPFQQCGTGFYRPFHMQHR